MSGYDSWLADQQEARDNPMCERCYTPTWCGDLEDGLCETCQAAAEDGAV